MKEELKKFATKVTEADFEKMCSHDFKELSGKREDVDVSKEICAALAEEDIIAGAEDDGIYLMDVTRTKDLLANRVWLDQEVKPLIVAAKAKPLNFTRSECKHQVEIGTPEAEKFNLSGQPGRIHCSLWKTQVENVVQINGKCVKTEHLTQSTPEGGPSQWGPDGKPEGKPLGNISASLNKKGEEEPEGGEPVGESEQSTPEARGQQIQGLQESDTDLVKTFFAEVQDKGASIMGFYDMIKTMSLEEQMRVLEIKSLAPETFPHGGDNEMVRNLQSEPEYAKRIIEGRLVLLRKLSGEAFQSYFTSIQGDDEKIQGVLQDEEVKALPTYKDIAAGYLNVIKDDEERLLNALNTKMFEGTQADIGAYEKAYMAFAKEDADKLENAIRNGAVSQNSRKEFEVQLYKLVKEDKERADQLIADGILTQENVGEEMVFASFDRRRNDEKAFLDMLSGTDDDNGFDAYSLGRYIKSRGLHINDFKNVDLQEKIVSMYAEAEDVNTLSKWVQTTVDPLRAIVVSALGNKYEQKYNYRTQSSDQLFDDSKNASEVHKEQLKKMKLESKKNFEGLRRIQLILNAANTDMIPWADFKKQYQQTVSKYPDATTLARNNGGKISKEFIDAAVQKLEEHSKFPITFQDYSYKPQQMVKDRENLTIQVNAPEEVMTKVDSDEDPYLSSWWDYLHGSQGTTNMHPQNYNTIGWVRVGVSEGGRDSVVVLEEIQSDLLDTLAHSNAAQVLQEALGHTGMSMLEGDTPETALRKLQNSLFNEMNLKEWKNWAVNKTFEFARQNRIRYVVMGKKDFKMDQANMQTQSVAKEYYESTPKEYGFTDAEGSDVKIPGVDNSNLWVREASV